MAINETLFRQTMRLWTTGVTVVTTSFEGIQHGMTVSSFTSVSAVPPIVLVSINQNARTHELMKKSGIFAVSILEKSQKAISDVFAGLVAEADDRFKGIQTKSMQTGSPIISGAVASFDCKIIETAVFGNNSVFFGEILDAEFNDDLKPLLYSNRAYKTLHK
jgi:flavin reductase (DIM6/NTAB) family NADH-FMN oxidoreductase RutF